MTDNITSNVPELTRDLTRAKADLDDFGYCIIADAMTALALETSSGSKDWHITIPGVAINVSGCWRTKASVSAT